MNGNMDPKTAETFEQKIEEAIADIIVKMGLKKLPLLPARQTMHLMAKAAVTVYEAAVENRLERRLRHNAVPEIITDNEAGQPGLLVFA